MKKIIFAIFIAGIILGGCRDEFLDRYPTTEIDESQAFDSIENAMAVLYGMYDLIAGSRLLGGWLQIANDLRGDDVFLSQHWNWNWFVPTFQYTWNAQLTDVRGPRGFWDRLYGVIGNVNAALNADLPFEGDALNEYMAELHIMRAQSYFSLVTLYAAPYTKAGGPQSPGVPMYTVNDPDAPADRATVQDVYDLIEADLEFARQHAVPQNNQSARIRFTRCYAYGLSARVALQKGEYGDAYDYVVAALADAPPLSTGADYIRGFSHDNTESVFVVPFNTDDYPIYQAMSSFYEHPEGYGNLFVTKELFDTYADDDVRLNWFIPFLFYNINNEDVNEFFGDDMFITYSWDGAFTLGRNEVMDFFDDGSYDPADFWALNYRPGHYSIYAKFPRMNASPGVSPGSVGLARPTVMRTSELLLIKAECEARGEGGGATAAQETLFQIQQRAQPSAVQSTNVGDDLIEEVLLERRKELVGEGFRMLDILRLGLPLERPDIQGPNWSNVMSLPAFDNKMIWPIPEAEIDANPLINEGDQNPGY